MFNELSAYSIETEEDKFLFMKPRVFYYAC